MGNPDNYIPLDDAKGIIITALEQYHPEFASYAENILFNDKRLNIVEVTEAKTKMMLCRPAGITVKDLQEKNMFMPEDEFLKKFGPHFTHQDNPTDFAIIDFEYDGSPLSVVWLAHELGHAIADDVQRERGMSFKDFSSDEMEQQAYFVQQIVSKYLKDNLTQPNLQNKDLGDKLSEMSSERIAQFTKAANDLGAAFNTPPERRMGMTLDVLAQNHNTLG
jgi:hypothetical protein